MCRRVAVADRSRSGRRVKGWQTAGRKAVSPIGDAQEVLLIILAMPDSTPR